VTAEWMDLAAHCSGRRIGRAVQARVRGQTSIKRRVWRRAGDRRTAATGGGGGGGGGGVVAWLRGCMVEWSSGFWVLGWRGGPAVASYTG
jgi:hypothetical protein